MIITTNSCKVTITDKLKRKAKRLYREATLSGMKFINNEGNIIANEVDPTAFDKANEILICEVITHVNDVEQKVDRDWLDNLDDDDYEIISNAVEKLKKSDNESLEEGKKNVSKTKDAIVD